MIQAQTTINGNINVDGRNRSYRLRIPPAATSGEDLALVVSLHGFSNTAALQESSSAMNDVADTAGFFVVYPNGTNVLLFLQGWNDDLSGGGVDDVAFIDALITELGNTYPIDTSRVFATGFSNGGGMTVSLGCALSGRIKAIAPVAASINPANAPFCNPAVYRPLLQIHGTLDLIVPYTGAAATIFYPASAPAEAFFRAWISRDACSAPVISNVPNTNPFDLSTVTLASLNSCASGQAYRFYRVVGGDHSIPGPGGLNKDLYSSAAIWQFFRSQGGAAPRLAEVQANAGTLNLSPNPAGDAVQINTGTEANWNVMVYDLQGKLLLTQNGNGTLAQINTAGLIPGLYEVAVQTGGQLSGRSKLLISR